MTANLQGSFSTFISSPGGLDKERAQIRSCIQSMNPVLQDLFNISLIVSSWEDTAPEATHKTDGNIQDRLNKKVERCHFFILMLSDRYGTIEEGQTISNTEREVETILDRYDSNRQIKILSYFKEINIGSGSSDQTSKVLELRNRIQELGMLTKSFSDDVDLRDKITNDLYRTAIGLVTSPYKKRCLSKFWSLGEQGDEDDKIVTTDLAIIYRPVEREYIDQGLNQEYWQKRFMPKIFFEDSKAIQKVQKMMRLIGYRSKVFVDTDVPVNVDELNKLYICCPRIPRALKNLKTYSDRKFNLIYTRGSVKIEWNIDTENPIVVRSPLNSYMKQQRHLQHLSDDWHAQLSRICARDFAVIARLSQKNNGTANSLSSIKDFYIAGIRGLGTWGAAWYLDRRYRELLDNPEQKDLYILVEVEYQNGRISNVFDVSDRDQKYFDKINRLSSVKNDINNYLRGC